MIFRRKTTVTQKNLVKKKEAQIYASRISEQKCWLFFLAQKKQNALLWFFKNTPLLASQCCDVRLHALWQCCCQQITKSFSGETFFLQQLSEEIFELFEKKKNSRILVLKQNISLFEKTQMISNYIFFSWV